MKSMTRISIVAVLLGAILLLDGCVDLTRNKKGSLITFTTSTGEVGTKTVYGDDYANHTWQYIVWEVGDVIQVVSDNAACASGKHFANYEIDEVTGNSNHQSYGTIAPTPNGLEWGDAQYYDFYSVTPPPGTGAVLALIGPDDLTTENADMIGKVRCNLPATPATPTTTTTKTVTADGTTYTYTVYPPDMDYAVMSASAKGFDKNSEEDVSLLFKPAFTAFEFNLTSADEEITVTKVELAAAGTTDRLAGTYLFTAGSSIVPSDAVPNPVEVVGTGNSSSVSMTMNQTLTASTGVTFTFFTIPIVNTGMVSLKVTTNRGTATLNLTKANSSEAYKFEPGKKYRINLLKVGETWKIFFDVDVDPWIEATPATTVII